MTLVEQHRRSMEVVGQRLFSCPHPQIGADDGLKPSTNLR